MDWMPIESAPKDGTPILIWVEGRLHEAKWIGHAHRPERFRTKDSDEGWWMMRWAEIDSYGVDAEDQPTHWMPLPAPPQEVRNE